ncbi:glycosyltransferase family 4 protein [Trichothermofontia sichuanensis B231]|uniref:glycosyltransferase family 4 protein n=1 Tax=Trichothermofontia sichuanensis TaxID=3045816 RepID=UPI002246C921|nr:glycosyltransferase family 4 protein [Trichothermofontia sichuanensis]UZQ55224.1 glycosyltransferase family 4 protein [Trichothermofontia sichuanensis B231]
MNILYTLTSYPPAIGGAQIHTHLLVQQLAQQHTITVTSHWKENRTDWLLGTTLNHPIPLNYQIDNIPVRQLGFTIPQKLFLAPWVLLYYPLMPIAIPLIAHTIHQQLKNLAPTADLIHNVRIGREGLSWASYYLARQRNIPFVFTPLHHPRWVGWRYREYIKLYQQADAAIALTPTEKQTLITLGVNPDRIHITGIGPVLAPQADPEHFRHTYGITGPIVLFLGQHYAYKGYRQVLEASKIVWQQHPDTQFVFIGPPVKASEAIFTEFADPRIHRLGTVSVQDKTNALAACDLLCVPSTQESFGGVYVEAWSFKKPVIGGRIPAIADVITDTIDGLLVNQNSQEIAEAILYLLNHSTHSTNMGLAGYEKVQKQYTWVQLAKKVEDIYTSLK